METGRDRLKSLLIILLEVIGAGEGPVRLDRKRFEDRVLAAGFDDEDLSDVLDWLQNQWLPVVQPLAGAAPDRTLENARGPRLLGEDERAYLDPDAFGLLLGLQAAGEITRQQMESLIGYASLVADTPLSRSAMGELVDQIFFLVPNERPPTLPVDGFGNIH
jgi:uncharacterized protein Smg (DUF494 family)